MNAWRAALAVSMVAVMACVAVGFDHVGDPLMLVESAGGGLLAVWGLQVAYSTLAAYRLGRSIQGVSRETIVAGVPCRVLAEGGRSAFVLGIVRPRIYLGAGLLRTLDMDELRAVVLHEEHHRRTRAPLRTAALDAWRRLGRSSTRAGSALDARLAQIEVDADRFALRQGVSRRAIASALLKSGSPKTGLGFSARAEARLNQLLDPMGARLSGHQRTMPYEWAAAVLVLGIIVICHLVV